MFFVPIFFYHHKKLEVAVYLFVLQVNCVVLVAVTMLTVTTLWVTLSLYLCGAT